MKIFQFIIFVSFVLNSSGEDVQQNVSDIGLNAEELILKYGYPYESYTVETDDGYLLTLQRIPYGKNHNKSVLNRIPALVVPGLVCDSAFYLTTGATSLAFILADNGYDVWLPNPRGSTLSKRHIALNPQIDKKEFWNFSFQELGYYDVPACIDYILNNTKQESLHYVGHSQGMTSYFAMLSDKPQYADKIRSAVALAPATTTEYLITPAKTFLYGFKDFSKYYIEVYESYELVPRSNALGKTAANLCVSGSIYLRICVDVILLFAGWTPYQLNIERIPVMATNTPAGASVKQLQHFLQLKDGIFRKYDYGVEENIKQYGQEIPPKYNLSNATPPIAIYHGDTDWIIHNEDSAHLASQLPNLIERKVYPGFNHLDVVWGVDAPKLIFKDVIKFLQLYS